MPPAVPRSESPRSRRGRQGPLRDGHYGRERGCRRSAMWPDRAGSIGTAQGRCRWRAARGLSPARTDRWSGSRNWPSPPEWCRPPVLSPTGWRSFHQERAWQEFEMRIVSAGHDRKRPPDNTIVRVVEAKPRIVSRREAKAGCPAGAKGQQAGRPVAQREDILGRKTRGGRCGGVALL